MLAIAVVLWLLGVPLATPLTMLMFLGAFIPIVSPIVAGALAALVALVTTGPWSVIQLWLPRPGRIGDPAHGL